MVWSSWMWVFISLYACNHTVGDADVPGYVAPAPHHLPRAWLVPCLGPMDSQAGGALDIILALHHPPHAARVELVAASVQPDISKGFIK